MIFFMLAGLSFFSFSQSLKTIPLGTAYAIWSGIGAFGTAVIGIVYFSESLEFWRLFFLTCLILSIVGLKIVSPH
jgi:quaternary ammonium compound-resistance protein SugE